MAGVVPVVPWWCSTPQAIIDKKGWLSSTGKECHLTAFWASELQLQTSYGDLIVDTTRALDYIKYGNKNSLWGPIIASGITPGYTYRMEISWPAIGGSQVIDFVYTQAMANAAVNYTITFPAHNGTSSWGQVENRPAEEFNTGIRAITLDTHLFTDEAWRWGSSLYGKVPGELILNVNTGQLFIIISKAYRQWTLNGSGSGTEEHWYGLYREAPRRTEYEGTSMTVRIYRN
jgi:hypothetical protein